MQMLQPWALVLLLVSPQPSSLLLLLLLLLFVLRLLQCLPHVLHQMLLLLVQMLSSVSLRWPQP
jgi:hypothetical protein